MSVKILLTVIATIAFFGIVQSAKIQCYVGAAVAGLTFDTKKDCDEGITMCKNVTTGVAGVSGSTLSCAGSDDTVGCKTATLQTTCVCAGALCNMFKSGAMGISAPAILVFTLAISGITFVF